MTRTNNAVRLNRNPNHNPNNNQNAGEGSNNLSVQTYRLPIVLSAPEAEVSGRLQLALDCHGYTEGDRKTIDRVCKDLLQEHAGAESVLDLNIRMRFVVDIVRHRFRRLNMPLNIHGPFTIEEESIAVILRGMRRVDEDVLEIPGTILKSVSKEIENSHNYAVASERAARRGVSLKVPWNVYDKFLPVLMWLDLDYERNSPESSLQIAYTRRNLVSLSWPMQRYAQDRELLLDQPRFLATLMAPYLRRQLEFYTQVRVVDDERFRSLPLSQEIRSRAHVRTLGALIDALVDLELTHFAQVRLCLTSQPNTYQLYFFILDNEKVINSIAIHSLTLEK